MLPTNPITAISRPIPIRRQPGAFDMQILNGDRDKKYTAQIKMLPAILSHELGKAPAGGEITLVMPKSAPDIAVVRIQETADRLMRLTGKDIKVVYS